MLVYQLSNSKTSWRRKSQRARSFWLMKVRSSAQIQSSKSLKSGIYQGSATINGYMVGSRLWIRCGPRNWFYKWFSITTYFMIQKIFIVDSQVDIGQAVESNIAEEVWRACEWEQLSRQEVVDSVVNKWFFILFLFFWCPRHLGCDSETKPEGIDDCLKFNGYFKHKYERYSWISWMCSPRVLILVSIPRRSCNNTFIAFIIHHKAPSQKPPVSKRLMIIFDFVTDIQHRCWAVK